jgi:hypothetical protein
MDNVLQINDLDFTASDIACAVRASRRSNTHAFPTQYENCIGNEKIEFLFNTGTYIDPAKSSLVFKLRVNTSNGAFIKYSFDNYLYQNSGASVLNLISEIYHESKDGSLMYKQNYVNIMQTTREYIVSNEWKNNVGTLIGGFAQDNPTFSYQDFATNTDVSINIPLASISDFFNTRSLMHPNLLSGSKLTIILSNPKLNIIAYNGSTGTPMAVPADTTVTFSNIGLNLQQVELYDGIQAVIKSSLLGGIKYSFYNVYNSKYEPTSTSFTFNIQFAASIVTYIAIKFYPRQRASISDLESTIASASISELSPTLSNLDDNSLGFSIRARLNGKAYPNYNITTAPQAYINTIQALNPISHSDTQNVDPLQNINHLGSGCVPFSNYCFNTTTTTGQSKGGFIIAFSLEKNRDIGLSGESTTASKTISIEVEGFTKYELYDMYAQLQYLSVASIYENNVIISK